MLSCFPCDDQEQSSVSSLNLSSEMMLTANNHSHNSHDLCPPMCICGCCGCEVALNYLHYNLSLIKIYFQDVKVPEYQTLATAHYSSTIWQPPQINS